PTIFSLSLHDALPIWPLAAGEVRAAVEAAAEHVLVAVLQFVDHRIGEAACCRVLDPGAVVERGYVADRDVLARDHVVAHEVLEEDRKSTRLNSRHVKI